MLPPRHSRLAPPDDLVKEAHQAYTSEKLWSSACASGSKGTGPLWQARSAKLHFDRPAFPCRYETNPMTPTYHSPRPGPSVGPSHAASVCEEEEDELPARGRGAVLHSVCGPEIQTVPCPSEVHSTSLLARSAHGSSSNTDRRGLHHLPVARRTVADLFVPDCVSNEAGDYYLTT